MNGIAQTDVSPSNFVPLARSREGMAEEIVSLSGPMPNPAGYLNYLLGLNDAALRSRRDQMAAESVKARFRR